MANIIAARFDTSEEAERAVRALVRAGCPEQFIDSFYTPQPGQHGRTPIGGDENADRGARGAGMGGVGGALAGAAAGLAVGAAVAAASPVVGPLAAVAGAGVGAYTGSLAGAMSTTEDGESAAPRSTDDRVARRGGAMVAVNVTRGREDEAVRLLREAGGQDLERAEGEFHDGKWVDFEAGLSYERL